MMRADANVTLECAVLALRLILLPLIICCVSLSIAVALIELTTEEIAANLRRLHKRDVLKLLIFPTVR